MRSCGWALALRLLRVLLPGGALVFFVSIGLRIVSGSVANDIATDLIEASDFLEQPLHAVVAAFTLGLVLYMIEPGNGAPQYYQNIPSSHLRTLLANRGKSADHVGLYLLLTDEKLPDHLQERALFYGAVYRVGFQIVFFAFLMVGLVPLAVLLLDLDENPASIELAPVEIVALAVVGAGIAWPFVRQALSGRSLRLRSRLTLLVALVSVACLSAWATMIAVSDIREAAMWTAGIANVVALLLWSILRLGGPWTARWAHFRGLTNQKPDVAHRPLQFGLIDLLVGLPAIGATVAIASLMSTGALLALMAILFAAVVLAHFRKHERQLYGIYRNQNLWLDNNIDSILVEYAKLIH